MEEAMTVFSACGYCRMWEGMGLGWANSLRETVAGNEYREGVSQRCDAMAESAEVSFALNQ
jgi:hypothetical protein